MSSKANDTQVGGSHYKDAIGVCPHCRGEIQHWDWAGQIPGMAYAATKYIARHRSKKGKEDLLKAIHYIQKIIEQEYPDDPTAYTASALKEVHDRGKFAADATDPCTEGAHWLVDGKCSSCGVVEYDSSPPEPPPNDSKRKGA